MKTRAQISADIRARAWKDFENALAGLTLLAAILYVVTLACTKAWQ